MNFSDDDLKEFRMEAVELLESAEKSLLALDEGGDFKRNYDAIFRAFHSIKGAAGMLSLDHLQSHMHQLEGILTAQQTQGEIHKRYIDFFLKGADAALKILSGDNVDFDYSISSGNKEASAPDPAPPSATGIRSHLDSEASDGRPRVLLVDDEPEIVEILTGALKKAGFEVRGFTQASEGLAEIRDFNPQVVLTDIVMPEMTGPELLKAIRLQSKDVPVVFVSGYVSKDVLLESISDDVFGVVEKPFKIVEIVKMCERAVATPRPVQLLGQSLWVLLGKFAQMDDYLRARGRDGERVALEKEVSHLLEGLGQLHRNTGGSRG